MSEKLRRHRYKLKNVCKQAHVYLKKTQVDSLSWAMTLSWMKIKSQLKVYHSKVRGVTYGNRQKLLKRLSCYREEDIKLIACREYDNPYDRYAIEIYASVKGKGTACLGYVSKQLAEGLAYMMDEEGARVLPILENVTGGGKGRAFGVNFSYVIVK